MAGDPSIEQVNAELRRVGEAADSLVRTAQELRTALDALSESVRASARASTEASPAPSSEHADPASAPVAGPDTGAASGGSGDTAPDGARIVALDMVLDGRPREEIAARLASEFGLADSDALLDEVYARVNG